MQFQLLKSDALTPLDLTGLSLVFSIGDESVVPLFTGALTITDALTGFCEISMSPAQINALNFVRAKLRYSVRQTAPGNLVLQTGYVQIEKTF